MGDEKIGVSGNEFMQAYSAVLNSRFVGRERITSRFNEILDYPRTGKPMPTVILRGQSGSGKSWLSCRFAQEIAERRIPLVVLDGRYQVARLPGGFEFISRELDNRYEIKTPRFKKIYGIYARRFLGIDSPDKPKEVSLFKDILRSFIKDHDEDSPIPKAIRKLHGEDWERVLPSKPVYEHLNCLALALSEDIESSTQRKKYPFVALLIDNWNDKWNRFAPHWFSLLNSSSRLLTVVCTSSNFVFKDSVELPVPFFDEAEARSSLRRRGIEANHAVASIISESGGNPAIISLAASLAELISRSGDIIRGDTFACQEKVAYSDQLITSILEKLRESEKEALYSAINASGLDIYKLGELFPEYPDLQEGLISTFGIFPFEPIFYENSPIYIHENFNNKISFQRDLQHMPGKQGIKLRCENLVLTPDNEAFEALATHIETDIEPYAALSNAIEKIIHYSQTGQIGLAEDIWRSVEPKEHERSLMAIHRGVGDSLLEKILSPSARATYYDRIECKLPEEEGRRRLGYARALFDKGKIDSALDELHDTVTLLSSAITESSGLEPSLWFVRGEILAFASKLLFPAGGYRDSLSAATKAAESLKRARDGGLDCAGLVSLKISDALISASQACKALNETKTALTWLERARENISHAAETRNLQLPDVTILSARTLEMKGQIFVQRESYDSAEEFFEASISEVENLAGRFDITNPSIILFIAGIYSSLADLMYRSGSEESAFEFINKAIANYDKYEDAIGGHDCDSLFGLGKIMLLKSGILSTDKSSAAISAAREAESFFKRAWIANPNNTSAFGRIDSLLTIAELLSEEDRPDDVLYEEIQRILDEKTSLDGISVPILERKIRLFRAKGTSLFRKYKYSQGARYFSGAINLYGELNHLAPDIPFAGEVAEMQMALSVALRKSGEPSEAFVCLQRAEEAFEFAANRQTQEGLKRILHSSIGIYNELASIGKDEEAFEIALFILELSSRVGGPEVLEVGHELLIYWESQELTSREKRRLEESATTLRELWGES
ncbi:ATP-binding protein [bacterium]|nr:ATP-binding protein [bacterium]